MRVKISPLSFGAILVEARKRSRACQRSIGPEEGTSAITHFRTLSARDQLQHIRPCGTLSIPWYREASSSFLLYCGASRHFFDRFFAPYSPVLPFPGPQTSRPCVSQGVPRRSLVDLPDVHEVSTSRSRVAGTSVADCLPHLRTQHAFLLESKRRFHHLFLHVSIDDRSRRWIPPRYRFN